MKKLFQFALVLVLISCQPKQNTESIAYDFPFQDPSFELEERIDDLISRLTLEEKSSLMLYNSPAIERLGIPEYNWWNECLHGVGRAGKATVFPQAIGLAATFDSDLMFRVADAISDEARAKHEAALRKGNRAQYAGLSFWTPNINIFRDPRWGRGQETYGEDPFLTAMLGISFVEGLQGSDPHYLKASACAKHYVVHSGPEKIRHHFNAIPSARDFRETYLLPFQALVQVGGVESVMCAYNRTYDEPCCGSKLLIQDILRDEWGFEGHVVSDCWALDDIWARHQVVETRPEAAAMALEAGINVNCGYIYKHIPEAVEAGLADASLVDAAIRPMLRTRFRLGLFDPPENNPYSGLPEDIVNCKEHVDLAYEAAVKSVVLLKNNGVLPLDPDKLKNLFVTGPTSSDLAVLMGNYNGFSGNMSTLLEGLIDRVDAGTIVEYSPGFMYHNDSLFHGFWQADRADAVVVGLGINFLYEGEEGDAMLNPNGGDRTRIELPSNQIDFLKKIKERIGDRPLIVVITGGSAMAIPELEQMADAILFAWYPGEQGGPAIADLILGNRNPSGRLPVTFYKSSEDLPPFDDYSMDGRTYRYFKGEALYPFGHGLSYSNFGYEDMEISVMPGYVNVSVDISNSGDMAGEEVVQVYVTKGDPEYWRPIKQLVAFHRVMLEAGHTEKVKFSILTEQLHYWDENNREYRLEPGEYELMIGSSSGDIRQTNTFTLE